MKKKVVFGSKLRPTKSVNRSCVRDKDIAHFTAFVLQKNTRVSLYIYVLIFHNSYHRTWPGVRSSSGSHPEKRLRLEM